MLMMRFRTTMFVKNFFPADAHDARKGFSCDAHDARSCHPLVDSQPSGAHDARSYGSS